MLYGFVVILRNILYTAGFLRRRRLPVKVISVGNITLGGTGKTPAVIEIALLLKRSGRHPAVISRGYGRKDESHMRAVSDGKNVFLGSQEGGDEPVLIATSLAGVPVVVGRDRYSAGLFSVQAFGADTVILDDGFQHIKLRRNLDILLVDAKEPFGNGSLFPAGILREPVAAVKRADAILITRADDEDTRLKMYLSETTKAPIFTSRHEPVDIVDIKTGEERPLAALKGTATIAFCGIGRPEEFISLLKSLGADVRHQSFYPDHYEYTRADMAEIFHKAVDSGAVMIITTEKDAVRLRPLNLDGIWALRIRLKVIEQEEWERMILSMEQDA